MNDFSSPCNDIIGNGLVVDQRPADDGFALFIKLFFRFFYGTFYTETESGVLCNYYFFHAMDYILNP